MSAPVECQHCRRPLRARKSRERGYGRQCWQDHKPAVAAPTPTIRPRRHQRHGKPYPGQTELDLLEDPGA